MRELLLEKNLLTILPENLDSLVNLNILTLADNPMEDPPKEVCTEGKEAIFTYLQTKRHMKIVATKVNQQNFWIIYSLLLWRGVSVKHIRLANGAARYTSIPCP